jgi:hypothetical protein
MACQFSKQFKKFCGYHPSNMDDPRLAVFRLDINVVLMEVCPIHIPNIELEHGSLTQ